MKPLTTDQSRVPGQLSQQPQQSGAYTWAFDEEQQRLLLDINSKDISASSTSSNSPPFSMGSASSPLELSGGSRPLTTAPPGSHIVGAHRRQHSTARHSSSTDNLFRPPGHPYAIPTSLSTGTLHPHLARRRRLPTHMDAMTEDQHLENLWTMHGVTGSAHLGAGLTDQLASASLHSEEWIPSGLQTPTIDEVLDSTYYSAVINPDRFTTVDPSLRQTYEVHNPFTEDLFPHFGEEDLTNPHDADMDLVDDHLDIRHDESPLSEEPEPKVTGRSKSSDSGVTARRPALKDQTQADEDKEHASSDHEHDDEKAHSKPSSNNFVNKLHLMISDPKAADFIWWTELGTSFVVSSAGEFSRSILGQHFKHNNFSSFVRQLNMYGFHKINRTPRNQRVQPDAQQWEFSHPKFLRGRQDLLEDIKRKPVEPDPSSARQRVELPSEVAAKLREMTVAHAEVVKALQAERGKVLQLTSIVKVLYDRVALSGPLPPFPLDLLDSRPPLRASVRSAGMDLAGNSLIPSGAAASSRTTRSRPAAGRTTRRGRSEEQDHIETVDHLTVEPSNASMLNGRIKSESNIFAR